LRPNTIRLEVRWDIRAQVDLAFETSRLEAAVCLGNLIERDPFSDTWPDGVIGQHTEESL
jgi:hypothetical protein